MKRSIILFFFVMVLSVPSIYAYPIRSDEIKNSDIKSKRISKRRIHHFRVEHNVPTLCQYDSGIQNVVILHQHDPEIQMSSSTARKSLCDQLNEFYREHQKGCTRASLALSIVSLGASIIALVHQLT